MVVWLRGYPGKILPKMHIKNKEWFVRRCPEIGFIWNFWVVLAQSLGIWEYSNKLILKNAFFSRCWRTSTLSNLQCAGRLPWRKCNSSWRSVSNLALHSSVSFLSDHILIVVTVISLTLFFPLQVTQFPVNSCDVRVHVNDALRRRVVSRFLDGWRTFP